MPNKRDTTGEVVESRPRWRLFQTAGLMLPRVLSSRWRGSGSCQKFYIRASAQEMHERLGLPLSGWWVLREIRSLISLRNTDATHLFAAAMREALNDNSSEEPDREILRSRIDQMEPAINTETYSMRGATIRQVSARTGRVRVRRRTRTAAAFDQTAWRLTM